MTRIFYKTVTKSAEALGFSRLASWAYGKWMRWWMNIDPDIGYYLFAEDYLGERIPLDAGRQNRGMKITDTLKIRFEDVE